jgi:hypothetical protein
VHPEHIPGFWRAQQGIPKNAIFRAILGIALSGAFKHIVQYE